MNKFILAAALGASAITAVKPALADPPSWAPANGRRDRDDRQDRRDDRRGDRRDDREARRDAWRSYNRYDWNRTDPREGRYYADRYYRDGRYYRPVRISRNDRVYRGNDGRYYCRRSDGTTGLIAGAAIGGLLGNSIGRGDSRVFATILGAGAGAALGSSIDRGQVVCR